VLYEHCLLEMECCTWIRLQTKIIVAEKLRVIDSDQGSGLRVRTLHTCFLSSKTKTVKLAAACIVAQDHVCLSWRCSLCSLSCQLSICTEVISSCPAAESPSSYFFLSRNLHPPYASFHRPDPVLPLRPNLPLSHHTNLQPPLQ
jgi:hypothetical protein